MKTSKTLYGAARYIRMHGWVKGVSNNSLGAACMAEAVYRVNRDGYDLAISFLDNVLGVWPTTFNDLNCKSADDAIAALEIAADIAHAEGR